MNASSNARASSTTTSSVLLRPRNRRLISGLDDSDDDATAALGPASITTTFGSRPISPVPIPHLSRPGASAQGSPRQKLSDNASTAPSSSIWGNPWTALQGLASDFLGADPLQERADHKRSRSMQAASRWKAGRSTSQPGSWGSFVASYSASANDIGSGTREEQLAAVRARKRRDLLTSGLPNQTDVLGRYKRRLSDERSPPTAQSTEVDGDALVYVHVVQKHDTLAGITIRYHCSVTTLRKANRMWPNDSVQMRERILLPVDACGVKGKPIGRPTHDLLDAESEAYALQQVEEVTRPGSQSGESWPMSRADADHRRHNSSSATTTSHDAEMIGKHDSWVLLPGSSTAIEILRVPRKAIGYFPPARRKSVSYSDLGSPSPSIDLDRSDKNSSLSRRPPGSPQSRIPQVRSSRNRSTSNASTAYLPSYLNGPGGVGTMGKEVRAPGPGQDGLNKMFAKHLPDVAPPRTQHALLTPELPLSHDEVFFADSGATTPNAGKNMNLENLGGAIESWMRRVAAKTQDALQPAARQKLARLSVGTARKGVDGIGDLIEMSDELDIAGDGGDGEEHTSSQSRVGLDNTSSGFSFPGETSIRGRGLGRVPSGSSMTYDKSTKAD